MKTKHSLAAPRFCICMIALSAVISSFAQSIHPVLTIHADQVTAKMPPTFYGLMTEEINYSYEGGLYGELIRNRSFKADASEAKFWNHVGEGTMTLDPGTPLNDALNVSLKLDATSATSSSPVGIVNGGYWGIPIHPQTAYKVSFFAKAANGFRGLFSASLESADSKTVFASTEISGIGSDWKKFEATLTTKDVKPSKDNIFKITTTTPGTIWFQQISLFPPTYKDRPNGNRIDVSQLLAEAKPKFLRFPGGNYVEGRDFKNRFDWKKTIGPLEQRPGHESPWHYWSTDGFGLPEFLGWCQDLNMEPVLAVFAGYVLNHDHVNPGPELEAYVQEALEEIEYVTGDSATTKWGAQRAKDGYPSPFKLRYVEIGNEDWFDKSGSYDGRFAQFYDAIKAKYPQLQIIATTGVKSRTPDVMDEHFYRGEDATEAQSFLYDQRDRTSKTKVFVGEWATRVGSPTPNMAGALGDAAWMCCLERNADLVIMHCYAPLFVNVSDLNKTPKEGGSMQWKTDLIGYDALTAYASPAYYAQKMFSLYQGDEVLSVTAQDLPSFTLTAPVGRQDKGKNRPNSPHEVKSLFYSATRESKSGKIIVKIVNRADTAQEVKMELSGVKSIDAEGTATVLKAANRNATNSVTAPKNIVPVTEKVNGLGTTFTRTFPPCSITVLELSGT